MKWYSYETSLKSISNYKGFRFKMYEDIQELYRKYLNGELGGGTGSGSKWYSGTGIPNPTLGVNDDYYFRIDTNDIYVKIEDSWGNPIANIKGETGDQGIQGIKGENGLQGEQGIQGENGLQGEQGIQGDEGPQGVQGIQGENGLQGEQGIQGIKGDTGDQGIQGIKGDTGDQGIQGEEGQQGIQGEEGLQGIQGEQGIQGNNGLDGNVDAIFYNGSGIPSAGLGNDGDYYINTVNSDVYFKSSGSWVIILNIQGIQGIQGDEGLQGDQGIQGIQGEIGERGPKGDTGNTGPQGNDGKLFGTVQAVTQTLGNVGIAYDTVNISGIWACDWADVGSYTQIRFYLRVNKIGTGTQTWQLWNHTDETEIVNIPDSGGAGIKILDSGWMAFSKPASSKVFRVRAKSTIAGDDPIIYGAMVMLK